MYHSATDGSDDGERAFSQRKDYGQALGQAKSGRAAVVPGYSPVKVAGRS